MAIVALAWSTLSGVARADDLYFLGPEGTGTERRGLMVVALPGGACAPLDEASVEALDEGVRVTLGDAAGPCARWVHLVAGAPRDHASIRVRHPSGTAAGAVAMGSERGLTVEAVLRGRKLLVRVEGAPEGEPVRVIAVHSGGETPLEREGDVFVGPRPPEGLVGVVARSTSLTGAAALTVGRVSGPAALIVPSALEIPPGGAPRVAAFLVVADRAGRLSRNVPLSVVSESGSLRRLDWMVPGLAAVSLSTRGEGAEVVDLSVSDRATELASAELPVGSGAPVRGELELAGEVERDTPFEVHATVRTLDDAALPPSHVRVLCPDGVSVPVGDDSVARCTAAEAGPALVTVQAMVDGQWVPLGTEPLSVREAPAPPQPAVARAPAPPPRPAPEPELEPEPSLSVGAFLRGTLDHWGKGGAGGGLRASWPVSALFRIGLEARYEARGLGAGPSPQVALELAGTRHELSTGAHVTLAPAIGRVRWVSRLALQGSVVRDRYELGGVPGEATGFLPSLALATGVSFGRAPWALELTVGATARFAQPSDTWREAPLAFFLELGGSLAP